MVVSKILFEITKMIPRVEIMFPLQVGICYILPYYQIIKRNTVKTRIKEPKL